MRVHKLNNVEQAMDLLEKHKVYLILSLCHVSCYVEANQQSLLVRGGGVSGRRVEWYEERAALSLRFQMNWFSACGSRLVKCVRAVLLITLHVITSKYLQASNYTANL